MMIRWSDHNWILDRFLELVLRVHLASSCGFNDSVEEFFAATSRHRFLRLRCWRFAVWIPWLSSLDFPKLLWFWLPIYVLSFIHYFPRQGNITGFAQIWWTHRSNVIPSRMTSIIAISEFFKIERDYYFTSRVARAAISTEIYISCSLSSQMGDPSDMYAT